MRLIALLSLVVLLGAGCIPAQVPAHLANTPGAPVVLAGNRFQAQAFSVEVPPGWRVITAAADAPVSVILVAPQDIALLMLSVAPVDAPPRLPVQAAVVTVSRQLSRVVGAPIYVYGTVIADEWGAVEPLLEQAIASVTAG